MDPILAFMAFLPLLLCRQQRWLAVGDSLTLARPGYVDVVNPDAERVVCYHLADCLVDWPSGQYDVIVVELGIHAVAGCDHLPAQSMDVFLERYAAILALAVRGADVVVAVNIPALWTDEDEIERVQAYNEAIAKLAAGYGVPVADVYSVTLGCAECVGADGFHPSSVGYERIGQVVRRAIQNADHFDSHRID